MHKVDECVSLRDLKNLTKIYQNIIEDYFMKPYRVRRSKIDNLGLYAAKDIKKGSKIIEYKGKLSQGEKLEENPKYDNDKAIYLFI